jgi:hypothetical protein
MPVAPEEFAEGLAKYPIVVHDQQGSDRHAKSASRNSYCWPEDANS